ncbi:GNAT family N-acetyltransferase [Planosporangium sp. 12N6]|uniref:GNAT family N-acetyltransferase n=1 Tax=Planosporangium spinosum TaxID=3402278 RepID=UPI003CE8D1CD
MTIGVTDVPERERFEARDSDADEALAGYLTYQLTGKIIAYTHVEVTVGYDGTDVADALTRAAMDDARVRGRTVVAIYPPLTQWLASHPEYRKIVAGSKKIR